MTRVVLALVLALGAPAIATAAELGLITGPEHGTYHQIGLDLKRLVGAGGIELRVYPSSGAIDNLGALYDRPRVQMGIVQSDVLDFVAGANARSLLARVATRLRLVFPLYDEHVHILARRGIRELDQLAGRRVAIGPEGSGTYLTARVLLKLADVRPAEIVAIDAERALARLKAGRIDAMVYVAAAPLALLRDGVSAADGLTLIPVMNKSVLETYGRVELPAGTYAWQTAPVSTLAVKAVLASFEQEGAACAHLSRFAERVAGGLGWLRKHGHPQWQRVDLAYPLPGWTRSACVREYVDPTGSAQASPSHDR